jgi:hypothetical protein
MQCSAQKHVSRGMVDGYLNTIKPYGWAKIAPEPEDKPWQLREFRVGSGRLRNARLIRLFWEINRLICSCPSHKTSFCITKTRSISRRSLSDAAAVQQYCWVIECGAWTLRKKHMPSIGNAWTKDFLSLRTNEPIRVCCLGFFVHHAFTVFPNS